MAKAKDTRCGRFSHKWDSGLCTVCHVEHPAAQRQRVWNAMMRHLYADPGESVRAVPPPPDYSTPEACTLRALERGSRDPWYLNLTVLARQDGRAYRAFRRAVERAGGTLTMAADVRDTYTSKWIVAEDPQYRDFLTMPGYRYNEKYGAGAPEPQRLTLRLASEVAAEAARAAAYLAERRAAVKVRRPRKQVAA